MEGGRCALGAPEVAGVSGAPSGDLRRGSLDRASPAGVSFLGAQLSEVEVSEVIWGGPGGAIYSRCRGSRVEVAGTRVHGCG